MVDRSDRDPPNLINGPGFELALELEVRISGIHQGPQVLACQTGRI
jgi:hypothetical protein